MSKIECPICHEMHDENVMCPCCSFEIHQLFLQPGKFQEIERKRISEHRGWWDQLKANTIDRVKYDEKVNELKIAVSRIAELENKILERKKPAAFLITNQKVVYCVYEGLNTFGSSKRNPDCECHQKIILPGIKVRPVHFSINVIQGEKHFSYVINEVGAEPTSLYLNSTTCAVGVDTFLNDDDEILFVVDKNESNIKFRINLN